MTRPRRPAHVSLTAARAEKLYGVPAEFYADVCGIPGYDPFRDISPKTHQFIAAAARFRLDFFPECLIHIEGDLGGQPFVLDPWQRAIVVNLFGWYRKGEVPARRRYRKCLVYVAKKNGKTTMCAGIALALTFLEEEAGGQVYSVAESKDQAAYAWKTAAKMVEAEPALASRCKVYGARGGSVQRAIHYEARGTVYKIISSDSKKQDGFNPSGAVVDEIHRFGDGEFIDLIDRSMIRRREPLMVYITTADYFRESPCNTIHDYAIKVRDGVLPDAEFLPVVYEADKDDDWRAKSTWKKANPALDHGLTWEACQREIRKAEAEPSSLNRLKRLNLNIVTSAITRWLDMDKWNGPCVGKTSALDLRWKLKGRGCWGGLDLGATQDLAVFGLVFPRREEDQVVYDVVPWYWMMRDTAAKREKDDQIPYLMWAEQGFIELTEGDSIDYQFIRRRVNQCWQSYDIRDIGFDRWNAKEISSQLQEEDGLKMVEVPQTITVLSEPAKRLESLVMSGGIRHGGHPVLSWNAGNAAIKTDVNENIRPVKDGKARLRIDGISALVTAIARILVAEPPKPPPRWMVIGGDEEETPHHGDTETRRTDGGGEE